MPEVYNRQCDNCKNEYKGFGKKYCSLKCVVRKPHSEQTKFKLSRTWFIKGHSVSEETRKKLIYLSKNRIPWNKGLKGFRAGKGTRPNSIPRGKDHWNYKEDRSNLKDRNVPELKEWRMSVFTRDNFRCKMCGVKEKIQAHHILPWRDYPELRFIINNGITLCHAHHPRKRAEEKRLSPYFMELVSVSSN